MYDYKCVMMPNYRLFLLGGLLLFLSSCHSTAVFRSPEPIAEFVTESDTFNRFFTGMLFYDPQEDRVISAQHEDKYFTPASTTKLLTFYTSLQLLGDSIPALKYAVSGDTLWFSGLGDPTFLHPDFHDTTVISFLKNRSEQLYYVPSAFQDEHYGPGWAWDDYSDYYMPEKSAFPLYGNVMRFEFQDSVRPTYRLIPAPLENLVYTDTVTFPTRYLKRDLSQNVFRYNPFKAPRYERTTEVPFITSDSLTIRLLTDTLGREVKLWNDPVRNWYFRRLNSVPADSVYKRLLFQSDNFVAEQLLLMCSGLISDTLSVNAAINFSETFILCDLPDEPIWVDGSGLSRYNMFTPRLMVEVLKRIYEELPEERIFALFPAGGESGTLKNWYAADPPYVYAKSGSLRHNYSLCGYLKTKSGKTLIFALMNNHIPGPSSMAKKEIERLFELIYEQY